jgi:hypothetical protein
LDSCGTTPGEPPSVPKNAWIALELAAKVTAIGSVGFKLPSTGL